MNRDVPGGTVIEPHPLQRSVGSAWTPAPGAPGEPRGCWPASGAGQLVRSVEPTNGEGDVTGEGEGEGDGEGEGEAAGGVVASCAGEGWAAQAVKSSARSASPRPLIA